MNLSKPSLQPPQPAVRCKTAVKCFLLTVCFIGIPLGGITAQGFDDLKDRARWKSFGVENWVDFDALERALPTRKPVSLDEWTLPRKGGKVAQLKALIAFTEAGPKGYDAVHVSAKVKTPKAPTAMTIGQIKAWTKATPGQPHAIGRYQFIPSTLNSLVRRAKFSDGTRFSPQVQDRLADLLLADAGINKFTKGRISRARFMDNLAKIWAGFPTRNGKSAYHGYAGNRATISLSFYQREMVKIFGK
jgi:muramidase (phage lysozyme)